MSFTRSVNRSVPVAASLPPVELHPDRPPVLHVPAPADPTAWAAEHRRALLGLAAEHGAVLVRGLGLRDTGQAAAVFARLAPALMTDTEAFAPRQVLAPGVYSSTAWPANQPMCMHHELSYVHRPPGLLLLGCLTAPTTGGATALADAAAVLDALPAELVRRFEREGWLLTRSYNDDIGASWTEAFGTDDRAAVENYCRANAIEFDWQDDGGLRTRQHRAAVVRHPATGRRCWFNQIAFFNEWTLECDVREYLLDVYGPGALPFNTAFPNGDPIGEDVVQLINTAYAEHTVREPWQSGDLMLIDNIRTAHSREAFEPPRDVLVAMAEPLPPAPFPATPTASPDRSTR
ncbi:alpha-ketoglutarate-dependent taurine dioxygenase [Streptomyces sp. 3211.6]|uniref:TauD/TfdA family dioxygenase n=1 Tax=Streptomyces sp. 3211.6 TaxID=1938845 RepID=UPI000C2B819C|nr:TauD/TfdA family dioxygenase [Streptomyces sp. 3211.6]RKT02231.1 alpha-ketoglutarate-dependent taurine dioxygenase [Streptomyces sp. 3211.6]